jgi:hypothetical protein
LGELIEAQKETERLLREQSQETEQRFQETKRLLKEQSRRYKHMLLFSGLLQRSIKHPPIRLKNLREYYRGYAQT